MHSGTVLFHVLALAGGAFANCQTGSCAQGDEHSVLQVDVKAPHEIRTAGLENSDAVAGIQPSGLSAEFGHYVFGIPTCLTIFALIAVWILKRSAVAISELAPYLAEFLGTFVLVFTIGCCALKGNPMWNATAIGFTLMAMIYCTGPISGGHLNPAVSISLGCCGKIAWSVVLGFCTAQILAGVAASCCFGYMFSPMTVTLAPVAPFSWWHAMIVEIMYTCMICFVVNSCAASRRNNSDGDGNQFYALAIGFVIIAGGYAAGGISGAAFNPAVALGLDICSLSDQIGWGFAWAFFEITGAVLAAFLFVCTRPEDYISDAEFPKYRPPIQVKCLAEFLGAFILVMTVGLNTVLRSGMTAWSAGACLTSMIYSVGDVSGGHFNPAVSLAVLVSGRDKISPFFFICYAAAQLMGGIYAGLLTSVFHVAGPNSDQTFNLEPARGYTFWAAGSAELVYTFMIAYAVVCTSTLRRPESQRTKQNFYFALAIGQSVTVGGIAIGSVSGGVLNPVVGAGMWLASAAHHPSWPLSPFGHFLLYSAWECWGGLIAGVILRMSHPHEYGALHDDNTGKFVCEFVGTFMLSFTVGCCVITGNPALNALAIGCALMIMIYCTGHVSGGHLNPAVSLSLFLSGKLDALILGGYWAAQITAGVVAGFLTTGLFFPRQAAVSPVAPFTWWNAMIVEVIYTAMICFVVNNTTAARRNNPYNDGNQFFALAIGWVIVAGGYAAGGISGAVFNPAVALGLDISSVGDHVGWGFAWMGFEFAGAAIAAMVFMVCRPEEYVMSDQQLQTYVPALVTKGFAEFIGTGAVVFTLCLNIVMGSPATGLSSGAALMCMMYALRDVSGGHFNPAVTVAVAASGRDKIQPIEIMTYIMVQFAAGVCAGLLAADFHIQGPRRDLTLPLGPVAPHDFFTAAVAELFFSGLLAYVFLATATVPPAFTQMTAQNFYFGLCVGAVTTLGAFAVGQVSGSVLNPASAAGITMESNVYFPTRIPTPFAELVKFVAWELCGGLLGSLAFVLTYPREYVGRDHGKMAAKCP